MSPTPRYRFGAYDRIIIRGNEYRALSTDSRGHDLKRTSSDGLVESFTHEDIQALHRMPDFRHDRDYWRESKAATRRLSGAERIADLSDGEQAKLLWREAYVREFMRLEASGEVVRTEASTRAAMRKIAGEVAQLDVARSLGPGKRNAYAKVTTRTPPCARTLLQWVRQYERADCDPLVLRDRRDRSGNRRLRQHPDAASLLRKLATRFADERRPSKAHIRRLTKVAFRRLNVVRDRKGLPMLPAPGRRAIDKALRTLDPFFVECARLGLETARRKRAPVLGGLNIVRPLQRVEMDEWQVDLMTFAVEIGIWEALTPAEREMIKPERRWLSVAIDSATRCILAMRLVETPSAASGLATLNMAVRDKGVWADAVGALSSWSMHGTMETLSVDYGPFGASDEGRAAVADLGVTLLLPKTGDPRLRGTIERMFGTLSTQLMEYFSGRSFSDVVKRGDYPAELQASLTVDELSDAAVRYVVDVYHRQPHEGLRGETPFDAWERLVARYGVIPLPDAHKRRAVFGIPLKRTITTRGVRVLGLQYTSSELEHHFLHHHNREVLVRIDPEDIGRISVRLGDPWTVVPLRPDLAALAGTSVQTWIAAGREVARRYAAAAEHSLPIMLEAIAAIDAMSKAALRRVRINATAPSQEEVDREEISAFRAFEISASSDPEEAKGSGWFGDLINVPSPEPPPQDPPKSDDSSDGDDYTMED